jgi:hypothetical protein
MVTRTPALATDPVAFRVGALADALDRRRGEGEARGAVAKRDLTRYYAIIAAAVPKVLATFSSDDMVHIRAATRGLPIDPRLLPGIMDTYLADPAIPYRGSSGGLVTLLKSLSLAELTCLVDYAERAHWL